MLPLYSDQQKNLSEIIPKTGISIDVMGKIHNYAVEIHLIVTQAQLLCFDFTYETI